MAEYGGYLVNRLEVGWEDRLREVAGKEGEGSGSRIWGEIDVEKKAEG